MSSTPDQKSCCSTPAPKPKRPGPGAYTPLFVIILLTALAAGAKQMSYPASSWSLWMHDFMGLFLLVFAMVKLFDLPGFATSFAKYDLLAARSRAYALLYPFLELALGLAYLAHWQPTTTYLATIILLTFGALGVLNTMRQGKELTCACMGQLLKVPVSTVTLTENFSMATMALAMLLR